MKRAPAIASRVGIGVLLLFGACRSQAQGSLTFKVGDEVEAHTIWSWAGPTGWANARVVEIDLAGQHKGPYLVKFDGQDREEWVTVQDIRARAGQGQGHQGQPPPRLPDNPAGVADGPANTAALVVGDRADVYLTGNTEGKARGTITAVVGGGYRVHYDGCAETTALGSEVVDRALVRPAATIRADAPEIRFLTGKWVMFTPSYPTTVVHGDDIYREYGTGAKAPPLQINADGTYVWYFDYGKPPVKGSWAPHAKMPGARFGTEVHDGLVLQDSKGQLWKVYRAKSLRDAQDRIEARMMCFGQTMMGTRVQ